MSNFKVPYVDLPTQFKESEKELTNIMLNTAKSGQFILRKEVLELEQKISKYLNVQYSVGVNSGTDALFLGLKAAGIKPGDEIITVAHTFIATIATIIHCGAKPILADIQDDGNVDPAKIEKLITNNTKAIMVVHMNGKVCDMEQIQNIANQYKLEIFEDAAQAFGASYNNKFAGSFGKFAGFSFHPMKVLGCMGDGGLITTNDKNIYEQLILLRNHGQLTKSELTVFGYNSRLDNFQAAILLYRLSILEEDLQKRRDVAKFYIDNLVSVNEIKLPSMDENKRRDVFSSFVIRARDRDNLKEFLLQNNIEVAVHWETPNHQQKMLDLNHFDLVQTEQYSKNILSLPIHPYLSLDQLNFVVKKIKEFYK